MSGHPDTVQIQARYMTLRLEAGRGLSLSNLPIGEGIQPLDASLINSKERTTFTAVTERDVFRPYIKRPPPVVKAAPPKATKPTVTPKPVVRSVPRIRVVGLPSWGKTAEVIIRNDSTNAVTRLKIGDTFAGGLIAAVDYRPKPHPTNPTSVSSSRVIIQIEDAFWSVEIGETSLDKHPITIEDLPPALTEADPES